MPRLVDGQFQIDPLVAKGGPGLGRTKFQQGLKLRGFFDPAHAPPAAAADRLDHHRPTGAGLCKPAQGVKIILRPGRGQDRQARFRRQRHRPLLVAEDRQGFGVGPDKDQSRRLAGSGEIGIFAQEAIARMHRFGAHGLGGGDHGLDIEIGSDPLAEKRPCIVAGPYVQAGMIVGGVEAQGNQSHLGDGAGQTKSDLAAIGDQNAREAGHRRLI